MMKPILPYTLITIFSFFIYYVSLGQGCHVEGTVIINEIGNFNGNDEYVELLVIGSSANPTAPVNLEGYIIDDNNFIEKNVGNEPGYLRLGSCFSSVLPGTLIFISSQSGDISSNISPYHIIAGYNCLKFCDMPFQNGTDYDACNVQTSDGIRRYIPMRNWGDVLQVRNPEGELVHAISWVKDYEHNDDSRTIYIRTTEEPFTLANTCVRFKTGKDWYNKDNYEISTAADKTPGQPNGTENADFIGRLKNGTLNRNFKATVVVKKQPTTLNDNDGEIAIYCQGGEPPYSVVVDGLIYEYPGEGTSANNQGVINLKNLFANNYRLVVSDRNSCGEEFTINLENAKQICAGECIEIGEESNELCNYTWTNGQQGSMQTVCPTTTTTYTLNGIDENGNQVEQNYTVEVKRAKLITNYPVVCGPAPATPGTVFISCQDQYITYKWDNNSTGNQRQTNYPGNYSVTVTDAEGCTLEGSIYIYDGNNPEDIKALFVGLGFEQDNDLLIMPIDGKPADLIESNLNNNCFNNFANDLLLEIDSPNEILDYSLLNYLCDEEQGYSKVFITENTDFCNDYGEVWQWFNNSTLKTFWQHLFKFGEENILFHADNIPKKVESDDWLSLTKNDFDKHYLFYFFAGNCPFVPNSPDFVLGSAFENTFHNWMYLNQNQHPTHQYIHNRRNFNCETNTVVLPWGQTFPVPEKVQEIRTLGTKPDGIMTGPEITFTGLTLRSQEWFEVKCVADETIFTDNYAKYQLYGHLWHMRCNYPDVIGKLANFTVVSTMESSIGSDLIKTAIGPPRFQVPIGLHFPFNINPHHLKAYFKYSSPIQIHYRYDCPWWRIAKFSKFKIGHLPFAHYTDDYTPTPIQCASNE